MSTPRLGDDSPAHQFSRGESIIRHREELRRRELERERALEAALEREVEMEMAHDQDLALEVERELLESRSGRAMSGHRRGNGGHSSLSSSLYDAHGEEEEEEEEEEEDALQQLLDSRPEKAGLLKFTRSRALHWDSLSKGRAPSDALTRGLVGAKSRHRNEPTATAVQLLSDERRWRGPGSHRHTWSASGKVVPEAKHKRVFKGKYARISSDAERRMLEEEQERARLHDVADVVHPLRVLRSADSKFSMTGHYEAVVDLEGGPTPLYPAPSVSGAGLSAQDRTPMAIPATSLVQSSFRVPRPSKKKHSSLARTRSGSGRQRRSLSTSQHRLHQSSTSSLREYLHKKRGGSASAASTEANSETKSHKGKKKTRKETKTKTKTKTNRTKTGDGAMMVATDSSADATFITGIDLGQLNRGFSGPSDEDDEEEDGADVDVEGVSVPAELASESRPPPGFVNVVETMSRCSATMHMPPQLEATMWRPYFESRQSRNLLCDAFWYTLMTAYTHGLSASPGAASGNKDRVDGDGRGSGSDNGTGTGAGEKRKAKRLVALSKDVFSRMAGNWIGLFLSVPPSAKDEFCGRYYDALAQFVHYALDEVAVHHGVNVCPLSVDEILGMAAEWTLGYVPALASASHWADTKLAKTQRMSKRSMTGNSAPARQLSSASQARRRRRPLSSLLTEKLRQQQQHHHHHQQQQPQYQLQQQTSSDGGRDRRGGSNNATKDSGDNNSNNTSSSNNHKNSGGEGNSDGPTRRLAPLLRPDQVVPTRVGRAVQVLSHSHFVSAYLDSLGRTQNSKHSVRIPVTANQNLRRAKGVSQAPPEDDSIRFLLSMRRESDKARSKNIVLKERYLLAKLENERASVLESRSGRARLRRIEEDRSNAVRDPAQLGAELVQRHRDTSAQNRDA